MVNIHNRIKKEYEKRQAKSRKILTAREAEVLSKVPGVALIDEAIKYAGLKYNRLLLLGSAPSNEVVKALQKRIDELNSEKARLMAEAGFPADYLEPVYHCQKCRDTGFVETEDGSQRCSCYRQLILDYLYSKSNLKLTEKENFSTFNEGYYADKADESRYGLSVSPRDNIALIRERCLSFIENFGSQDTKNLFFSGPTGTGKTFMVNCIANELLKKRFTVLYQTAPMLYNVINEYRARALNDDAFDDAGYKYIFDVDLLIIDDLGTEPPSAAKYAEFLNILNTRQVNDLSRPCKTLLTTNIGMKKLHEYYDERVMSRIVGNFEILRFIGDDIRGIKKLASHHPVHENPLKL